jgi:hypothetical protein
MIPEVGAHDKYKFPLNIWRNGPSVSPLRNEGGSRGCKNNYLKL